MEENLVLGLKLLVVGMLTVCLILYIVILLGKGLIAFSNRFPENMQPLGNNFTPCPHGRKRWTNGQKYDIV